VVRSLPPLNNGKLRRRDRRAHWQLLELRKRFARVSRRIERPTRLRRITRQVALAVSVGALLGVAVATFDHYAPWSIWTVARHIAAAPNCNAARTVGLAPSNRGEPGYYRRHDADSDGIACEPFPRHP
jgi:hypothetical protein